MTSLYINASIEAAVELEALVTNNMQGHRKAFSEAPDLQSRSISEPCEPLC